MPAENDSDGPGRREHAAAVDNRHSMESGRRFTGDAPIRQAGRLARFRDGVVEFSFRKDPAHNHPVTILRGQIDREMSF